MCHELRASLLLALAAYIGKASAVQQVLDVPLAELRINAIRIISVAHECMARYGQRHSCAVYHEHERTAACGGIAPLPRRSSNCPLTNYDSDVQLASGDRTGGRSASPVHACIYT